MTTYSVVGMGKLGASMAAAIASRGFDVVGVDVSGDAVDRVNVGRAPVQETGLDELIAANHARIRATTSHHEAVLGSDLTFVVVPTPSDERGAFSTRYAAEAFHAIGRALAAKQGYHTVVLTSTVLPGATRFGLLPILEEASGKVCGEDFGLCYSPEFIALGSVIRDFLNPDFLLIGEFDKRSGEQLEACYAAIMENSPPTRRMSLENAELTKIALNAFVTTKITFANMLADLCERIPGGDVDAVSDALGLDRRIGRRYLTGGLGFGGPCFPRDNVALGFIARAIGAAADLPQTTHAANEALPDALVGRLRPIIRPGARVAVLGLAYKPFSHVVEESQSVKIIRSLLTLGARVTAYDPLAGPAARAELGDAVVIADSPAACLAGVDVVFITTPDDAFRALTADHFRHAAEGVVVVDVWRILQPAVVTDPTICYLAIGRSSDDAANAARLAALWADAAQIHHGEPVAGPDPVAAGGFVRS